MYVDSFALAFDDKYICLVRFWLFRLELLQTGNKKKTTQFVGDISSNEIKSLSLLFFDKMTNMKLMVRFLLISWLMVVAIECGQHEGNDSF